MRPVVLTPKPDEDKTRKVQTHIINIDLKILNKTLTRPGTYRKDHND